MIRSLCGTSDRSRRAPWRVAFLGALLGLSVVASAGAQIPPGGAGAEGAISDVPSGPGVILVQVVHSEDPAKAEGLDVALYALAPDGTPGLRSGVTDASGTARFEDVSTASDVVYLVGARYLDIPFGRRLVFESGAQEASIRIEVSDPSTDTSSVSVADVEWRLQWLGAQLWVHETHTLVNASERVVQVTEAARAGARPAFEGRLPDGSSEFSPVLGSFSQGLERDGDSLRFWGPVYPGRQEVRFQYRLELSGAAEGETLEVETRWPSGAERLQLWSPETGPVVATADAAAVDPVERSGERFRILELAAVEPGAAIPVRVQVPAASSDPERLQISRADLWIDVDDVAAVVSQEVRLQVSEGPRLVAAGGVPLLVFDLPPSAEMLGASQNSTSIGLASVDDAANARTRLMLMGPLPPGETSFGVRYRLPVSDPDAPFEMPIAWPIEVAVMNVLVADAGYIVEDARLHRMRPVRSGTRNYIHREGFQIEPGEEIALSITRIPRGGAPQWASLGLVLVAAAAGAGFLLQPLRGASRRAATSPDAAERSSLAREREGVVESLRDLDHDFETGKIESGDYEALRATLRAQAVELMRREREETERPVREVEPPSPSASVPEAPSRFCPHCGAAAEADWRFCAVCGGRLGPTPVANDGNGA